MSASAAPAGISRWRLPVLAFLLAASSFALQGRVGINLADEGFLWYGVQRTAAGEVPLRDFQAYDPGRYYWCAAGTLLFGKGLVGLRASEAVFQALGLWAGLLVARRVTRDWKLLVSIGVMLVFWMFPSHKLFDHTLLLVALLVAVRLVEKPSRGRVFLAGCYIGLSAFFGRNHALYGVVATGALLGLLFWKTRDEVPISRSLFWLSGIAVGLLPLLAMLAFVPGFFAAFLASIESIFRHGANLGVPVPWPWRIPYGGNLSTMLPGILLGTLFLALPFFYLGVIALSLRMGAPELKKNALLVAGGILGLVYLHHAFARADASHLAQAVHPFMLALCVATIRIRRSPGYLWLAVALLAGAGLVLGFRLTPLFQRLVAPVPWVEFDAGGKMFIPPREASLFACLRKVVDENLDSRETLLIAPVAPGLYALLGRPSPLWELYFFFPASAAEQAKAIDDLKTRQVNWALVSKATFDRREDLRFASSHKAVWNYLTTNFQAVRLQCLPRGMQLLHRKPSSWPNESSAK